MIFFTHYLGYSPKIFQCIDLDLVDSVRAKTLMHVITHGQRSFCYNNRLPERDFVLLYENTFFRLEKNT